MQKTYITTMPDKAGAFLRASEIIAGEGGNIVRVNYNKAVDLHTLFIDVAADSQEQLRRITEGLREIGYLAGQQEKPQVMLIELKLLDVPGSLRPVLEMLSRYDINISYLNSLENGTAYQYFKMGLFLENPKLVKGLLDEISTICDVMILEYSITEKVLDSTVFYLGFAGEMRSLLGLSQKETNRFIIESNKIMQILDAKNETPFKTFEYIRNFAKFIVEHKGSNFRPIISQRKLTERVLAYIIEPPCGSNTYILDDGQELLFVDGGFQCFLEEMKPILYSLIPDLDQRKKIMTLTHADIDHDGLIPMFDQVLVSETCFQNFVFDFEGRDNFREQNPVHAPYCRLSKIISGYTPPNPDKLKILGRKSGRDTLSHIGELRFGDLCFQLYEGNGGHVKGETVFYDRDNRVLFTGDNLVNIQGFSKDQMAFNALAPYLMTSVNVDSKEATACRKLLTKWAKGCFVCPGHGMWEQY